MINLELIENQAVKEQKIINSGEWSSGVKLSPKTVLALIRIARLAKAYMTVESGFAKHHAFDQLFDALEVIE